MISKDYFSDRVTIREYSDEKISEEMLNSIIERAMRAPTCGNMQLYSVIVTKSPEMKSKLAPLHFNQPAATGCDIILTICADFNRFSRWCSLSKAEPGYSNFHSFMMACTDAIIFTQQIVTIAENEGLGTCYLGTVNYNAKEISELLELPELVVPVASLSLGYPAGKSSRPERLPLNAVLHNEKYRHDSDDDIKNLFREKEEFPENKEYVKINNKETLAQVFTDIRYSLQTNEAVSASFMELLREKGFA